MLVQDRVGDQPSFEDYFLDLLRGKDVDESDCVRSGDDQQRVDWNIVDGDGQ